MKSGLLNKELHVISSHRIAPVQPEEAASSVVSILADEKALDVMHIDLRGRTSIADHLVIASGRTQRQIGAMADQLVQSLKAQGLSVSVEGKNSGDWVLLDAGDIIVHLLRPEVRAFYGIERMWGETTPEPDAALSV